MLQESNKVKLFLAYIHRNDIVMATCITSKIAFLNTLGWLRKKEFSA